MTQLVLIGGPPAVGKSSVLRALTGKLDGSACLDADDVWRVRPFELHESLSAIWVGNVVSVLRGYLEARLPYVFVSWVFANPELTQRVLDGVAGRYDSLLVLYLVASAEALEQRHLREPERGRVLDYGLGKLAQIQALPQPKIDTTHLSPEAVAERIIAML